MDEIGTDAPKPERLTIVDSAYRWERPPGNLDTTHFTELYPSTNQWGIPDMAPVSLIPGNLMAWVDRKKIPEGNPDNIAVHFFIHDYRFEGVWSHPKRHLGLIQSIGVVLSPDFSVYCNMPRCVQIYNTYRNRWMGAMWQRHGVTVIPTLAWGGPETYDFAFAGVPEHSVVCIRSQTARNKPWLLKMFCDGVLELVRQKHPSTILVYGDSKTVPVLPEGTDVRQYSTLWHQVWGKLKKEGQSQNRGKYVGKDRPRAQRADPATPPRRSVLSGRLFRS
jgi:hypothetical protein